MRQAIVFSNESSLNYAQSLAIADPSGDYAFQMSEGRSFALTASFTMPDNAYIEIPATSRITIPAGLYFIAKTGLYSFVAADAFDGAGTLYLNSPTPESGVDIGELPVLATKGDLATFGASGPTALAVGTDGQVLTADSTAATGLKWAASLTAGALDGYATEAYVSDYVAENLVSTTITGTGANIVVSTIGTAASPGALRSAEGTEGAIAFALGYWAADDGGGGLFAWYDTLPETANSGTAISAGATGGGWVRIPSADRKINVRHFGAIPGQSYATISAQFQEALNYAAAQKRNIFVPSGTYGLSTGLIIPEDMRGLTFEGETRENTVLQGRTADMTVLTIPQNAGHAVRHCQFRHFTIDGLSTANVGLWAYAMYECHLEQIYIHHCKRFGFQLADLCISNQWSHCQTGNNTVAGVRIGGGSTVYGNNSNNFHDCRFSANLTGYGIYMDSYNSFMNTVQQCILESNTTGIAIRGYSNANAVCWLITGNYFANYGRDIDVIGHSGNPLQAIWIDKNFVTPGLGAGSPAGNQAIWGRFVNVRNSKISNHYCAKWHIEKYNMNADFEIEDATYSVEIQLASDLWELWSEDIAVPEITTVA